MRLLLQDKEDTEQVFHIMDALNGDSSRSRLKQFVKTEKGRSMLERRVELPSLMDNHERWLALPAGTVGRAYADFMRREGLTAAGLVAESEKWWDKQDRAEDDMEFYSRRLRDTHDLMHVISGYGRDQLGEAAVLAFSHGHNKGLGNLFIAYIGAYDLHKRAPKSAQVMKVISEARRIGKNSTPLITEDIIALMHEPLIEARKRLNVEEPVFYKKAIAELNETINYNAQMAAA